MKIRQQNNFKLQRGVASLFIAVILLIAITMVVLFTSKTVLMESKIVSDDFRTAQATAAAQAAMDRALAYAGESDMNHDSLLNGSGADYTPPTTAQMPSVGNCVIPVGSPAYAETLTDVASGQNTISLYYFANTRLYDDNNNGVADEENPCDCSSDDCLAENLSDASPVDVGMVVAKGWSDDCTAVRTITHCISKIDILSDNGPDQPFVTRGGIGIAGNATFINRYNNSNIWTGSALGSSGAAFATYLRPAGVSYSDLTTAEKNAGCPNPCNPNTASNNVRLVSNTKAGYGVDIIGDDPTLGNITADEMFALFFGSKTKDDIRNKAKEKGKYFTNVTDIQGKDGLAWLDDASSSAPSLGTEENPIVLVVNGDFTIGSNAVIHGVVYVIGELTVNGSPDIFGSVVSESGETKGNGSPTIVYVPLGGDDNPPPPTFPTPLPGSWKDW